MGIPVRQGDVIDGAYVVDRLLGQGGMGAVFVAHEERLGRRVAIKVLSVGHDNAEAHARFEREARSAAALQSDHVARVFSVGHLPDKTPYIVMELLEGEDLASLLAKRGRLPAPEVVSMMLQVCDALSEAHALGIVHRDLKPANIFLARRPSGASTIKVLDFGISKGASTGATVSPLTNAKAVMGTPLYMSPEQVREVRAVDVRTDVWSLGAVMYELLTGRSPFHAESLPGVFHRILEVAPRRSSEVRPDVTPALDAVVMRCLEKDPAARFASARELASALAAASQSASERDLAAAPATPPGVSATAPMRALDPGPPTGMPPPGAGSAAATVAARPRNAYAQPVEPPRSPPAHSSIDAPRLPPAAPRASVMAGAADGTGPQPAQMAAPPAALAGTVDPLVFRTGATTRSSARPSAAVIAAVFFGAAALAGLLIYFGFFRAVAEETSTPPVAAESAPFSAAASPPFETTSAAPTASSPAASAASSPAATNASASAVASPHTHAPGPAAVTPAASPAKPTATPVIAPVSPPGRTPAAPAAPPTTTLPPSQPPPLPPATPPAAPQQPRPAPAKSGTLMPATRT